MNVRPLTHLATETIRDDGAHLDAKVLADGILQLVAEMSRQRGKIDMLRSGIRALRKAAREVAAGPQASVEAHARLLAVLEGTQDMEDDDGH